MNVVVSRTIVFITGAFVTHHGWEPWQAYFNSKGYNTIAPPWPFKDGTPDELRKRQPGDTDLAKLTLEEVVDHYAGIVSSFPEKPIAIGHSLGGLITQILVNRDLVAAGVAIHSVPPQGVFPYEFSFLKAGWKALGFFTSLKKTYLMSFKDWQYAFVNGMSLEDQKKAYEENTTPESKTVARGGLTSAAHVDFNKKHPPLRMTAGRMDNIIPVHLNRRNYCRYANNGSILDFHEEGKNHFVVGLPGWQEDAEYIANWLTSITKKQDAKAMAASN